MTPEDWLESARHRRRAGAGLPDLRAALEGLARAAAVLRAGRLERRCLRRGRPRGRRAATRRMNGPVELPSLVDLARAIRAGETTSQAATERCLAVIRDRDPSINAFITVLADAALDAARTADRELRAGHDRGLLHGVPISVKDIFDVAGRAHDGRVARAPRARGRARRHGGGAPAPGWRGARGQDQPPRVRARHDQRGVGVRAGAPPARSHAVRPADRPAVRPRRCSPAWRTPRSAPTPAARFAFRRRRAGWWG